jgi:DNA-directed RNA polymerase specialized sigma24 family protein
MELYQELRKQFRSKLLRELGNNADDVIHDAWIITTAATEAGNVKDPIAYGAAVIRNLKAKAIRALYSARMHEPLDNAAEAALQEASQPSAPDRRAVRLARKAIEEATPKQRDVLLRLYWDEQPRHQIMRELKLQPRQMTQLKNKTLTKAKATIRKWSGT